MVLFKARFYELEIVGFSCYFVSVWSVGWLSGDGLAKVGGGGLHETHPLIVHTVHILLY